jgi:hypothetical protein
MRRQRFETLLSDLCAIIFSIHYSEQYQTGTESEYRWERHPNLRIYLTAQLVSGKLITVVPVYLVSMPQIFEFYCTNPDCEFEMPSGWGYYMYAIADDGERVHCPHPGEMGRAREVTGENASQEEIDRRTGFNTYCFCIHCETQVDLDLDRDEKACPECRSNAVKTIDELVDEQCPVCEEATFVAEDTGAIA